MLIEQHICPVSLSSYFNSCVHSSSNFLLKMCSSVALNGVQFPFSLVVPVGKVGMTINRSQSCLNDPVVLAPDVKFAWILLHIFFVVLVN